MRNFSPNCTLPTQTAVYVAAPNVRSTLDIVWNCVSILILCSWSILHLDVPAQYTPRSNSQCIRRFVWLSIRKITWMLVSLVAPEVIVAKAVFSFYAAQRSNPGLKELAVRDSVPWSMAHTFLANMGGLFIHFPETCSLRSETRHAEAGPSSPHDLNEKTERFLEREKRATLRYGDTAWRLHDYNVSFGNYAGINKIRFLGNIWVLNARQLQYARECGIISQLPNIMENELADKGRGDFAAKALALIQVLWLIIQIVVRTATNKPSSPLEVATLAFATLAFIFYVLLFQHPQNLMTPFQVSAQRLPKSVEFRDIHNMEPIPNHYRRFRSIGINLFLLGGILSGLIFGSIHLLAWNFTFPTRIEKILWISSSFITALLPPLEFFNIFCLSLLKTRPKWNPIPYILGFFTIIFPAGFLLARLFLVAEMFRLLYFLPPDAYLNTWTTNVPHIGA